MAVAVAYLCSRMAPLQQRPCAALVLSWVLHALGALYEAWRRLLPISLIDV